MNPWWLAVKPGSLPKIVLPLAVGLCMGFAAVGTVDHRLIAMALVLAFCVQWCIVLLNDYADRDADIAHQARFPALIDARVLVEGLLAPGQVLAAGLLAAGGAVASGAALVFLCDRPHAIYLALLGLAVFWAYSFAPLRLNYRGGGELLETMGVGAILPMTGYYIAAGALPLANGHLFLPVVLYAFIGALTSGLKHEPADRENGKVTACVLFGAARVRKLIWAAQMAARVWCGAFFLTGEYGHFALVLGALAPSAPMFITRRFDADADYRNVPALSRYKQSIVQAGYLTSLALALDFAFSNA